MLPARSRLHYAIASLIIIALGLATRPLKRINDELGSALGDALYAVLVYLLLVIAFPRLRPLYALLLATGIAYLIEASQLWHPPLLNAIRQTTLGGLTIGGSFSFGDLVWYLSGTIGAFLVERVIESQSEREPYVSRSL